MFLRNLLARFAGTPITALFFGIISRWFFSLFPLCLVVMYWVLKGLGASGILDASFVTLQKASLEIKAVAQFCTPKILDIKDFIHCLGDTPQYIGDDVTNLFEQDIKQEEDKFNTKLQKHPVSHDNIKLLNPYDSEYENP